MRSFQALITSALAFAIFHCAALTCGISAETVKARNQVVIAGLGGGGALNVFEFRDGKYEQIWSTMDSDVQRSTGLKIGDFNNDGVNEFLLVRNLQNAKPTERESVLEAWAYDRTTRGWARIFRRSFGQGTYSWLTYVGAIGDFDRDGLNEVLVTNSLQGAFEIWGSKQRRARTIEKLATVHQCAVDRSDPKAGSEEAWYIKTAADLNGNGVPEIVTHCKEPSFDLKVAPRSKIVMYEFRNGAYVAVGSVPSPLHIIDASDTGDLDGDGRPEVVLCGNSSTSHVLTFRDGAYRVDYTAPRIVIEGNPVTFTQACSIGDLTNDGKADWADVGGGLVRIFSHQANGYAQLLKGTWWSNPYGGLAPLGASAIGDVDNDGQMELLHGASGGIIGGGDRKGERIPGGAWVWKAKGGNATTLENVYTFASPGSITAVAVGPLM